MFVFPPLHLTIDPSASTLYSTFFLRAVLNPLQATAHHFTEMCTTDVLGSKANEKCVRSHSHYRRMNLDRHGGDACFQRCRPRHRHLHRVPRREGERVEK